MTFLKKEQNLNHFNIKKSQLWKINQELPLVGETKHSLRSENAADHQELTIHKKTKRSAVQAKLNQWFTQHDLHVSTSKTVEKKVQIKQQVALKDMRWRHSIDLYHFYTQLVINNNTSHTLTLTETFTIKNVIILMTERLIMTVDATLTLH